MALKASDVFVVQQATGAQALAKVSAYELSEWVETTGGVHYIGTGDFTNAAAEPVNPNIGDLWINSATGGGTFAWTYDPNAATLPFVFPNDKAVWNNSYWDVLPADSGTSVVEIQAVQPITVANLPDPSRPIVGIDKATTTSDGSVTLASSADLAAGDSSKVVTADQLATVIEDIESLGAGTVTSVTSAVPGNPITVTDSTTTPVIAIKDATTSQKGVVTLASSGDIFAKDSTKVVTADQLPDPITSIDGGVYAEDGIYGNWSSMCTGSVSSGREYEKAFDGITNEESSRCIPANGSTVTFIPDNQIDGNVGLWVTSTSSSLSANSLTVNGTDYTANVIAEFPGDIDTPFLVSIPESEINNTQGITWTNNGFVEGLIGLAGVKVGDTLLIDSQ